MGAMKHLWQALNDYDESMLVYNDEGQGELHGKDSELLNLIGYFNDIDKGVEMFKQGVTLKEIEEEYADMPSEWVYSILKGAK